MGYNLPPLTGLPKNQGKLLEIIARHGLRAVGVILHAVWNDTFDRLTVSRRRLRFEQHRRLRLAVKRAIPCRERYSFSTVHEPSGPIHLYCNAVAVTRSER